jgi:hypothetical protein
MTPNLPPDIALLPFWLGREGGNCKLRIAKCKLKNEDGRNLVGQFLA